MRLQIILVKTLLKYKSKLRSINEWKNVWINADLTRSQQIQIKALRNTLRQKRIRRRFKFNYKIW